MLPEDLENYVAEAARVLKNGGRCLISFFLLNTASKDRIHAGKSTIQMDLHSGPCWTANPADTEMAIGQEEDFLLSLYDKYRLQIARPIHYGG